MRFFLYIFLSVLWQISTSNPVFLKDSSLLDHLSSILGVPLTPFSKSSPDDPDIYRTEGELFYHRDYSFQIHKAMTPDNYILTLWRVARLHEEPTFKQYPIILQHGLLDSAFSWILNRNNESLAYVLASLGYDVWLTNNRGTKYSNEHQDLTDSDDDYWKFSFDEFNQYDLPTNIEYIKNITGASKVIYIGHSQGTTQLFAHLTEHPEFKENLKLFFGLGPVIKVDHQESLLIKAMLKLRVDDIMSFLGFTSALYLSRDNFPTLGIVCEKLSGICVDVVRFICGDSEIVHYNQSRMSVMASHEPGGTSVQNLQHWFQLMRTGEFRKYDFGVEGNKLKYGNEVAPLYNVSNLMQFDVEKHLYIGGKDYLANLVDYPFLLENLPKESTFSHLVPDYAHLDYCWGTDAYDLIYKEIISIIEKTN